MQFFNLKKIFFLNFHFQINIVQPEVKSNEIIKQNNSIKLHYKHSTALLDCPLMGDEPIQRIWSLNLTQINPNLMDNSIQLNSDNSTIKVIELDENLEGLYSCNASNEFGHSILNYKIELAGQF